VREQGRHARSLLQLQWEAVSAPRDDDDRIPGRSNLFYGIEKMHSTSHQGPSRGGAPYQLVRSIPTLPVPPVADPDDPFRVRRSHLGKSELGKSSSSCKVSLVTRLHRTAILQEFWCASYEEACVYQCLAAHPDVVNFAEQLTRLDFIDDDGRETHTRVDAHVLLRCGEEVLVSVKYDEKARRATYLTEVASIASQSPQSTADRITTASRFSFHPSYRECVRQIQLSKSGWDPEADRIVLSIAELLPETFTFGNLVESSGLGPRGHRAAIRLIGDGDLHKSLLDPIVYDTRLARGRT
jgi:hypothetical protein